MKKHIILLSFLFFSICAVNAQHWDSLARGVITPDPSIGGVNALAIYDGYLYAGGTQIYVDSTLCIGRWDGNNWKRVGNGITSYYYPCGSCPTSVPAVYALAEYSGNLFAGGFFDDSMPNGSAYYSIAQWNNSVWDSVSSGLPGAYNQLNYWDAAAYCIAVYQNVLYMGGNFRYTNAGTQVNYINQWSGNQWGGVDSGMNGPVSTLAVYNGNLYAGGGFTMAGGTSVSNIAMWDGVQWNRVSSGINGGVVCLYVFNGKLYAGGTFDSAGGQRASNIACWNDTAWTPVGMGIAHEIGNNNYYNNGVYALTSYGPDLCAGGVFDTAGNVPANNIALWDGSTWSSIGKGVDGSVNALIEYNGALIAGGNFDSAGGIPVNNIAQWTSPLGVNEIANKNIDISAYPNPSTGKFTLGVRNKEQGISEMQIEIYNVLGENVYSTPLNLPNRGNFEINLSNQPNGIYFYRVITNTGSLIGEGKMVVQK